MDLSIRKAEKNDMGSLLRLMNHLLGMEEGDFPNDSAQQERGFGMVIDSDTADVFVAEKGGAIVGMCSLHQYISTVQGCHAGFIEDVVVDDQYTGLGIGTMLMEYAEQYAKSIGVNRLSLSVHADNETAKALYEKMGWTETKYVGFMKYI